jgi:hypothetical protein
MEVVQQENEAVTIGRRSGIEERSDEKIISKLLEYEKCEEWRRPDDDEGDVGSNSADNTDYYDLDVLGYS